MMNGKFMNIRLVAILLMLCAACAWLCGCSDTQNTKNSAPSTSVGLDSSEINSSDSDRSSTSTSDTCSDTETKVSSDTSSQKYNSGDSSSYGKESEKAEISSSSKEITDDGKMSDGNAPSDKSKSEDQKNLFENGIVLPDDEW